MPTRRLIAGLLGIAAFLFFAATGDDARAQLEGSIDLGDNCSYFGEVLPDNVMTFTSDMEAEQAIRDIVDVIGLVPRFETKAAGVPNAAAVIQGQHRFILYNQHFMRTVRQQTGNRWAPISILAHEIGHHLNAHTLMAGGSRPAIELEADVFSGSVLQRLGASLDDARSAMELLGTDTGSSTHPAKRDRLAAITNGWMRSCRADANCDATGGGRSRP